MNSKEKLLSAMLLEMASSYMSRRSCGDLPQDIENFLTQDEWDVLNKEYHGWNGDPENYRPGVILSYDWLWMDYMARKLRNDAKV